MLVVGAGVGNSWPRRNPKLSRGRPRCRTRPAREFGVAGTPTAEQDVPVDAPNVVPVTEDGRYIVIGGRRWRATDPAIPESLRKELVAELMSARRDVRVDPDSARPRVNDAKVALGERGDPWWEPTPAGQRARLAAAIRVLLRHRNPEATICPSDAARIVGGESWRGLMDTARSVAAQLAQQEIVIVRQHGLDIDLATAVGPVRLARGRKW